MTARRLATSLLAGMLLASTGSTIAMASDRWTCSNGYLNGLYAYHLSGTDLRNYPPTGFSASGVFRADGKGHITYWHDAFAVHAPGDTAKTVVPDVDFVAAAQAVGSEITYTVAEDCRVEIVYTAISPAGPVDFHLRGALAQFGREVMLQTGAPYILGTGVAKRTGTR